MDITLQQIAAALETAQAVAIQADLQFETSIESNDAWDRANAEWNVELAYLHLIVLTEVLDLPLLREELTSARNAARTAGLLEELADPDGAVHLRHLATPRRVRRALQATFLTESSQTVTKDLEAIIRGCTYAITDRTVFPSAPDSENVVHRRIEAVLRCVFPDLLHKPRLAKPIKNFEPDTGIPSIETLVEYKFISAPDQVDAVADQLLADTRGYTSKEWHSFVYVIYETQRFKPESEWRQLLRACETAANSSVIVLTGEPARGSSRRPRGSSRAS